MNTQTFQHTHWQIAPENAEQIQGIDDLHQCIRNILSTRKGADVLRPEFGSNHFDYIDQPFDIAVPNMVREIFLAIAQWETRIILKQVNISGEAPHFYFELQWCIRDEIERQLYSTEFEQ